MYVVNVNTHLDIQPRGNAARVLRTSIKEFSHKHRFQLHRSVPSGTISVPIMQELAVFRWEQPCVLGTSARARNYTFEHPSPLFNIHIMAEVIRHRVSHPFEEEEEEEDTVEALLGEPEARLDNGFANVIVVDNLPGTPSLFCPS